MRDKINYANCMQRKCEQCRYYDYCFRYKPKKEKKNEIQNKQQRMDNNGNIPTIN